ncbi:MAG: 50S ribosomal protein L28 [Niastella sp.]|jgi:large subunit ribosomal protein L28|uniref:50S ribosomal protein L28 n=1 Tax=Paraflavitalea sp. CAU 1676 TaxID=3032598 RepID=UPI001B15B3F7|nr:50S ribosomal protein L28 [Paraflavitalea sp. CAU 1676]MBO9564711.1 50S ribosomal protein L28 [Niastella sp.]MDF2192643.1 50S ribosomal protein L28 [Paraflavitalea sp. CAU 1676]
MARVCQVTGKVPVSGHRVSHSNIKSKRRFLPNLQTKRFFLAEEDKWITLKLSTEGIRTINKRGLSVVVKELRAQGEKI